MSSKSIPYGRQEITEDDIEAVVEVLRSDFLTQGPRVPAFEEALAECCSAQYAVAVNSGTSALHVACLSLGVGPGDVVWTSPITFVASANCALYCGASVDFVDIDPRTYNISVERLAHKLADTRSAGRQLPKVIIPVHLAGQPCEMATIQTLSKEYGFRIIEDASHALGGYYRGEPIGNGRYGDITVFSFHPVKNITTGEGGAALTNDPQLASCMARLRTHGITRDITEMIREPDGYWYYEQLDLGFNYRMTDLQAALGLNQLRRLGAYVAKRHVLKTAYDKLLAEFPITTPWQHVDGYSGLHLYIIRLHLHAIRVGRRQVFERLRHAGIGVNLHYIPVYRQPYFTRFGFYPSDFPEAERYYAEAISLPLYPGLTEEQQLYVVQSLRNALGE